MLIYRSVELFRWLAFRSETLSLQRHVLFRLRVERRIDNETVDEDPDVILHLMRFDGHSALVLLFHVLLQLFGDHVGDVVHVTTALRRSDAVDE